LMGPFYSVALLILIRLAKKVSARPGTRGKLAQAESHAGTPAGKLRFHAHYHAHYKEPYRKRNPVYLLY
ncbi:hypothetical protein, partial [Faecalispora jeddahensis]|uniref:hypothetical protein n=1 Tax=Faecalispora jeddahensis TaxID=1414721 RepID=UPI001A9AD304